MGPNITTVKEIRIGSVRIGGENPIALIAGPCVIESERHAMETAERLKRIAEDAGIHFIYKSSYDKANRTSIHSYRGPGLREGLQTLRKIKRELGLPVLSDVHSEEEVEPAAEVLDVIQIPAFLCRQTDLVVKAARTGKPVNVKKGQFLAPWDMKNVVRKIEESGNNQILLTERGFMFGYNNMVVDMRSLVLMREFGYPVVFDATHSVQLPGGQGSSSGGQRDMVPHLARGAVAVGCDCLFLETHPDPDNAPSDGPNMLELDRLPGLLRQIKELDRIRLGK
ncbi:MAG: 3-deoxy-8-phosphooctulonate synthase [Nitrospinae bacterium]|nr:3-deoxy-8-phosphooctulonate synthase [Nitrospinota bacterium]